MSASQQRKDRELIGQHSRLYERLYGDVAVAEGDDLPFHPVLARAWILTHRQKERALADYNRQKRDVGNMQLLAIAFPIHFFLLDQWFLGFLFWFSFGGVGVWWVIEWFIVPHRVDRYNDLIADEVVERHLLIKY
ncbi:MAG: TM2 domain-containing protein [Acidimicrobiaceae bacterium]|nr:TM2 domain-containing protein [Acidimicrobiaceae bacterium]